MANTTLKKITVTTVATTLIGVANAPMFAKANDTKLVTQQFNGTLSLNNSSNYSDQAKNSYSGFVTYSKQTNGTRCPKKKFAFS